MSHQESVIWQTLLQAGLVEGDVPVVNTLESPWYVNVILAISAWFASFFFLGFLGMGLWSLQDPVTAFVIGSIMLGVSYFMMRAGGNKIFVEHTALALSLAGQLLITWVFFDAFSIDNPLPWFFVAVFQAILVVVMPSFIHRVMSSLFSALCLTVGLSFSGVSYLSSSIIMAIVVLVWLNEFTYPQHVKRQNTIGYGLVLALIIIKGLSLFGIDFKNWGDNVDYSTWALPWIGELLSGIVTLYLVWKILQRLGHHTASLISIATLAGTAALSLASMEANGITVGLVILLLGFSNSNKVLIGLGITSLLFYISSYYYLLDNTLMEKSQTLLIVGLLLLGMRWVMRRIVENEKAMQHD